MGRSFSLPRPLPWKLILGTLLAAALLIGVVYVPVRLLIDARALHRQHPGVFTVHGCSYDGAGKGYYQAVCDGDFRSDDGTVVGRGVTVSYRTSSNIEIEPRRGDKRRAWLAGDADRTADLDSDVRLAWIPPLVEEAVLLPWLIAQIGYLVRESRRRRAAGPGSAG